METEASTLANDIFGLVMVVILALLNAFFVAAEFSLVSVRRTRIEELLSSGVAVQAPSRPLVIVSAPLPVP